MEWKVAIEGVDNQRILVRFSPKTEEVFFIGQYKPHNKEWMDFSEEIYSMDIDLDIIQDLLGKVVKKMRERLAAYNNLAEEFTVLKLIEVKDED